MSGDKTNTMTKTKPCKLCSTKRYANTTLCYSHYRAKEKKKREEKARKKLERKKKTKKYQEECRRTLHKKCWRMQSEIIRRSNTDKQGRKKCYTCKRVFHWKELHAGHYRHNALDFDARNLKAQCPACNTYRGGMMAEYTINLIKDHSLEWVEKLKNDADKHLGYRYDDLLKIEKRLALELKKLRQEDDL